MTEDNNQRVTNAKIFAKLEALDARFTSMEARFREWRDETRECNADFEERIRANEALRIQDGIWKAEHHAKHDRISKDLGALRQTDNGSKRAQAAIGATGGGIVAVLIAVIKELLNP